MAVAGRVGKGMLTCGAIIILTVSLCSTFINFILANNLSSLHANFVYAMFAELGKLGNVMFSRLCFLI